MNQMQDIRTRGERLQQEVALAMVTEEILITLK